MKEFENTLRLLLNNIGIPSMDFTVEGLHRLRGILQNHQNHPDFSEASHIVASFLYKKTINKA